MHIDTIDGLLLAKDFNTLCLEELAWPAAVNYPAYPFEDAGETHVLSAVAECRGVAVWGCPVIPDSAVGVSMAHKLARRMTGVHVLLFSGDWKGRPHALLKLVEAPFPGVVLSTALAYRLDAPDRSVLPRGADPLTEQSRRSVRRLFHCLAHDFPASSQRTDKNCLWLLREWVFGQRA